MSSFNDFNLDPQINQMLQEIGYEKPTPVQEQAIPIVLSGKDVLASAQTGTGKTAAFMLPLLHMLCNPEYKGNFGPQAVILVPTRELAIQVSEEAKKFSRYLPRVKTVCIYGGVPYPIQKRALSSKFEILVATPGRLIDHMQQGRLNFSNVKMFVLDEADRMLDMGFLEAVEEISNAIPKTRQTLLFSATIDRKILPVSRELQNDPQEIRVQASLERQNAIEQKLYYVDNIGHKLRLLDHILENTEINQSIIFTSTIRQAGELAEELQEKGHSSEALHGDMNQRQRTRTIDRLRQGKVKFLIATDVAARGIDVATITHVINFDLPFVAEDFIHRIGRTGRAGATGCAITFATFREKFRISSITKVLGKQIDVHTIEGFEPAVQDRGSRPFPSRDRRGGPGSFSRGPRPFNRGPREDRDSAPFSREPRAFNRGPREDRDAAPFSREPRPFNRGPRDDAAPFAREPRSFNRGPRDDAAPFSKGPRSFRGPSSEGRDAPFARGPKPFRGPREEGAPSFARKEGKPPFAFGGDKKKTQWRKTPK